MKFISDEFSMNSIFLSSAASYLAERIQDAGWDVSNDVVHISDVSVAGTEVLLDDDQLLPAGDLQESWKGSQGIF